MKKSIAYILATALLLVLTACGDTTVKPDGNNMYDITIACAEESTKESYIITYWNDRVISESGTFHVCNLNDFSITVYLGSTAEEEIVLELLPGEEKAVSDLKTNESYQVGVYADVKENDEIKFLLTDGE